ncbi:MAG: rRNA pseudouridine synthase [Oscillospiraceae bacterium]|jgi:23S rRNA pseudouridine2605 synthase|nr:rRNA pseudouridine synthase [Oscillospiraceae bacterium]
MKERLQKILAERGVCSRRACERLISDGRVAVNGAVAFLGDSADAEKDEITLDGRKIPAPPGRVYILLNKPRGYISAAIDVRGRKTVTELAADCGARVFPVGRLDMDSEGLLILTNDGELANMLAHPSHGVEKEYLVSVRGDVSASLPALRAPITLDDGHTVTAKSVTDCGGGVLRVIIGEGRNRQVRKMCAESGLEVVRLVRVREGALRLGDLPEGAWRYLTPGELAALKERKTDGA